MAHLLRGKQAGVQNDFSANIDQDSFILDDLRRYGINSKVNEISYDPVQSLLAVGTARTLVGPGQIYVFGRGRIVAVFSLPTSKASVKTLQFCSDKLLCMDDRNDLCIFNLLTKKLSISYSPPGTVSAFASDPTLDYALLGLATGEIIAFDIDREALAPFKLPCFWAEKNPKFRNVPVVSLQFHPRDIGKLLIGYVEGAVVYSFKQNVPRQFFHYHVPRGAPGGDGDPASISVARNPKLLDALWHPTGTFILTAHEDSSLVYWDPKDSRLILARSLTDTNVDRPGPGTAMLDLGQYQPKTPFLKIAWCANQDPDDTSLLVAGGISAFVPSKGMTLFELGRTPNYMTSTWPIITDHFENPKRQRILPTPPNVEVTNFCLIPRKTPWFAGAHDPIALLAILSSGEIATLSFPTGYPISPTNQLPMSMTFVHPFVNKIAHASIDRARWLGMTEVRSSGPKFLNGGAEAPRPMRRFEKRSIIQTAHADGTVRIWDAGHGDEIENESLCQADIARAVGRIDDIEITELSLSGASGELVAGLTSGEMVVFRWSRNKRPGRDTPNPMPPQLNVLTDVSDQMDPSLTEGFHPHTLLAKQDGPVTAVVASDVGFIAGGFRSGCLIVIDMRGPAIIFEANISDVVQKDKGRLLGKRTEPKQMAWVTKLEFSVMTLDNDAYSSILLHAGTSNGHVATFKILPDQGGRYSVEPVGFTSLEGSFISIVALNSTTGQQANATQSTVGSLRSGMKVDGVVLAVTDQGARIFRPASSKGAHKSWDVPCESAGLTRCQDLGSALVGIFRDGTVRAFSVPGLREIASKKVDHILHAQRLKDAVVTPTGDILGWTGPSEMALLNIWGSGEGQRVSEDIIFNPAALIPPRPTISNFQWVSGTQYMTPSDLDLLIGGPTRPPSKRMLAQAQADAIAARTAASASRTAGSSSRATAESQAEEGYWSYMQRQINERTEKLGIMGDSMERLEDNSASWASEASKYVSKQKKGLIMGVVKHKMGL